MSNPDLIEMAGNCPRCQRPCEGYRIIAPDSLIAVICRACQTITLLTKGWDICVGSFGWWTDVTEKLAEMLRPIE